MLHPDVYAKIRLYAPNENGRRLPTPENFFACIFEVDNKKHDCRLLLDKIGSISPGQTVEDVPIIFLRSDLVLPKLSEGKKFYIWEMGHIAEGTVTSIVKASKQRAP